MEARLRTLSTPALRSNDLAWREVVFSVEEARRALPYVARVVRDAAIAYQQVQDCRDALRDHVGAQARAQLTERRDAALRTLNAAIDECNAVGADLRDISQGMVRFGAQIDGREVSLSWHMHEPIECAWQSLCDPGV